MEMSIELDKEYIAAYNNPQSSEYKKLKSDIESVVSTQLTPYLILTCTFSCGQMLISLISLPQLRGQYNKIIGYINVFVTRFRYCMVILALTKIWKCE